MCPLSFQYQHVSNVQMWSRTSQGAFFSFSLLKPRKNNLRTPKHQTLKWPFICTQRMEENFNWIQIHLHCGTRMKCWKPYLHVHFILESMAKTSNKNHDYLQLQGDFKARDSLKLRWILDLVIFYHIVRTWPIIYFTLY